MTECACASHLAREVIWSGLARSGHIEAGVVAHPLHDSVLNRPFCRSAKTVIVDLDRVSAFIDPDQSMDHELPAKCNLHLVLIGRPEASGEHHCRQLLSVVDDFYGFPVALQARKRGRCDNLELSAILHSQG